MLMTDGPGVCARIGRAALLLHMELMEGAHCIQLAEELGWRFRESGPHLSAAFAETAKGQARLGGPLSPGSSQVITPARWSDCL